MEFTDQINAESKAALCLVFSDLLALTKTVPNIDFPVESRSSQELAIVGERYSPHFTSLLSIWPC